MTAPADIPDEDSLSVQLARRIRDSLPPKTAEQIADIAMVARRIDERRRDRAAAEQSRESA